MLTIMIRTSNDAFHDYTDNISDEYATRSEVRRILSRTIEEIDAGKLEGRCTDINGNTVGSWFLE